MRTRPQLSPAEERSRQVLDVLMRLFDLTDAALAERKGVSYQAVQHRRNGRTRMRQQDVEDYAALLEVPSDLFRQGPIEAVKWVAEQQGDLLIRTLVWTSVLADQAA